MPRDSLGNYTLPLGGEGWTNPVTSGTPIAPDWANATLQDIAAALTDSMSRTGSGVLQIPLRLLDGSVSAPSLTFDSSPTSGLYRTGALVALSVAGTWRQQWTTTGTSINGTLSVSGSTTLSSTLAVTGAVTVPGPTADTHADTQGARNTAVANHANNTTTAHGAVSTATASKTVIRDANGRAQVADPSATADIDTLGARNTAIATAISPLAPKASPTFTGTVTLPAPAGDTTADRVGERNTAIAAAGVSAPTVNTVMRRDAAGRSQVVDPIAPGDVDTMRARNEALDGSDGKSGITWNTGWADSGSNTSLRKVGAYVILNLRAALSSGTNFQILTLPAGYRPPVQISSAGYDYSASPRVSCLLEVSNTGNVMVGNTDPVTGHIYCGTLVFPAA